MAETTTTTDTPRDSDAGTIPWVPGAVGMVVITVLIGAGYVMLGKAVLPVLDHPVSAEHLAALKTEMATVETTLETKRDSGPRRSKSSMKKSRGKSLRQPTSRRRRKPQKQQPTTGLQP
jgi:heme A synthase